MRRLALALAVVLFTSRAGAEETSCTPGTSVELDGLGTPTDDLLRAAEVSGAAAPTPRLLRRAGEREAQLCADGVLPWSAVEARGGVVRLLPLRLTTTENTGYPSGGNDGLLWSGRGISTLVSGGAMLRWRYFTASLAPAASWQQNAWFATRPTGLSGDLAFANPYYGEALDVPARFGAGPFARASLGESFARVDLGAFGFGISNERLWFGPGQRNSILMSGTAPGFPHVFAGTGRPVDIRIGNLEAVAIAGRLSRSRYVDGAQGSPLFSALLVGYEPAFAPGLTVGLTRIFLQHWSHSIGDYFPWLQSFWKQDVPTRPGGLPGDNPDDNQLASLYARWVFPAARVEVYGELAYEDYATTLKSFLNSPEYSSAVQGGIVKLFGSGARWVRVTAEGTWLQEIRAPFDWTAPVYYTHLGGLSYTNQGELLGASIGPGSDTQTIAVDVFEPWGRWGVFAERVRRNEKWFIDNVEPLGGARHDLELVFGARGVAFAPVRLAGPVEIGWEASFAQRYNRDFLRDARNVRLVLDVAVPLGAR